MHVAPVTFARLSLPLMEKVASLWAIWGERPSLAFKKSIKNKLHTIQMYILDRK